MVVEGGVVENVDCEKEGGVDEPLGEWDGTREEE